jgi:hypothetical protein
LDVSGDLDFENAWEELRHAMDEEMGLLLTAKWIQASPHSAASRGAGKHCI